MAALRRVALNILTLLQQYFWPKLSIRRLPGWWPATPPGWSRSWPCDDFVNALGVPWTEPPTGRSGRPRKHAGRFDRARIGELPDEGKRLHHAHLHYKPFRKLLQVVFVLNADEDPAVVRKPPTLFAADPEIAPEGICRIHRDRFQIEFNFRDTKQHLELAACHHFHVNAVLAWTQLELRAADRALDRFSMANVKLGNFLELVLQRLFEAVGPDRTLQEYPEALLELGQIEPKPT